MPYSIDTSSFLDAWVRFYPPDLFPKLWEQMGDAADKGVLFASDEVLRELSKKDDGAHDWMKKHSFMVAKLDKDVENSVIAIMKNYPRLVDTRKGRSVGDPFVIALAHSKKLTVITSENPTGNIAKPKIPDVCGDMGIPCVPLIEFFRSQKWVMG